VARPEERRAWLPWETRPSLRSGTCHPNVILSKAKDLSGTERLEMLRFAEHDNHEPGSEIASYSSAFGSARSPTEGRVCGPSARSIRFF